MPAKEGSKNNSKRLPGYFYAFVVIPAQAGIQWFYTIHSRRAGMTVTGMTTERVIR